jgi:nucleoside-diphosphate-sugar epimerase
MPTQQPVLLLGGTGRTGKRVLQQLLGRGVPVRAIVRSAGRLPAIAAGDPNLEVIEASLPSLDDAALRRHLAGCQAVVSCLGHVLSARGIWGPPRDLVCRVTARLCREIEALRPAAPVKLVLMTSVSVIRPGRLDTRRGRLERTVMWLLRGLLPPAMDNQRAADHLQAEIGASHPFVQWAVVRPDALLEGEVTRYLLHEGLVSSLFAPDSTNMANVAHFMCELVTTPETWEAWKGKLPVIVNAVAPDGTAPRHG